MSGSTKYACALCGKRQIAEQMIYSPWTKQRYCAYDIDACDARARKRKKKVTVD